MSASPLGSDVRTDWPGQLNPVKFTALRPKLPSTTHQILKRVGVPKYFCFSNDFEIDFTIGTTKSTNIETQWNENVLDESFPESLSAYWTLGHLSAGGIFKWLCIECRTGRIVTVDWENQIIVHTLNKSPLTLTRCMLALLKWSSESAGTKSDCQQLKEELRKIDAESRMWIYFVERLLRHNELVKVGVRKFKS